MSLRAFLPTPSLALLGALVALGGGCSLLEGGNSPRTAVRILEGGAVSDRHYARVTPDDVEQAARLALRSRGFTEVETERGGRGSSSSRTLNASCPTDGRALVLIDEVDLGDVQVTIEVIPADETLARDLQAEIARRLAAPGKPTSSSPNSTIVAASARRQ